MIILKLGVCDGRHELPVNDFFFSSIENPLDFEWMEKEVSKKLETLDNFDILELYITGLTPALTSILKVCLKKNIKIKLFHFNREAGEYISQTFC